MIPTILQQRATLLFELTKRDVLSRYRGSALGIFWSALTPLFMLAVFTFVFGSVFRVRWGPTVTLPHSELALLIFSGLVVFNLFAESVLQAPTSVSRNASYVKRIVFPLELLPLIYIATALFHGMISFAILLCGRLIVMGSIPPTALLVPIVLLPLLLATAGICLLLGALGVFVRDIGQTMGLLVTVMMFLSPIFYPMDALPPAAARIIGLNPIARPIEDVRAVLLFGNQPEWLHFGISLAVALVLAWLGASVFQRSRRGFADVL